MFEKPPEKIIYAFGAYQESFKEIENNSPQVVLHHGLPTEDFIENTFQNLSHCLIILDDLIEEIGRSKEMCNLFIRDVHHKNVTVVLLYQNLFHQSRFMRTISLNLLYFVLMKTYRDKAQISHLARQMFPDCPKRMEESYNDCIKTPRGYLVVTNVTTTEDEDRLVTNIFPDEILTMYLPK